MNMKKIALPILLLALGVGGFIALKATKPSSKPIQAEERVWRVEVMTVQRARLSPSLALTGTLESPALTKSAAPAAGRILRVAVREGQSVSRGQSLLEMDPRDLQPAVDQALGQVRELEAAIRSETLRHQADLDQLEKEQQLLQFAAADLARFQALQQANFYSPAAVDQSRSALAKQSLSVRTRELAIADHQARLAQLEARRLQARAALDQAELARSRGQVVAAFDGFVAEVSVAEGDQVNPGQALLTLYPRAGLEVRAKIPAPYQEDLLARLNQGGALKATARIAEASLPLTLRRVAGAADARGLDAFFSLDAPQGGVRLGSLVNLKLARPPIDEAIRIPFAALFGGNSVYRLVDGRLQAVGVRVHGESLDETAQLLVTSPDLREGDRLLATHLPNAVTGLRAEANP